MSKDFETRWPETTFRKVKGRLFKPDKNVAIFMQPVHRSNGLVYVALQLLVGPYKSIEQDFYYDVSNPPATKNAELELLDRIGDWAIKESADHLRQKSAEYTAQADSLLHACSEDTENA